MGPVSPHCSSQHVVSLVGSRTTFATCHYGNGCHYLLAGTSGRMWAFQTVEVARRMVGEGVVGVKRQDTPGEVEQRTVMVAKVSVGWRRTGA